MLHWLTILFMIDFSIHWKITSWCINKQTYTQTKVQTHNLLQYIKITLLKHQGKHIVTIFEPSYKLKTCYGPEWIN